MVERGGRQVAIPGFRDFVEIGRGGFAVVYRAQQEVFQRDVAVKVITVLDVSDDARRRFRRECTAIGRLEWHPHIVTVFDAGDTPEGWPYIVMEYLPEGSLGDRIARRGAVPWPEVVGIGIKIAGALQAAHDEGSLHRDVKPDNVLMSRLGEPKLGDFGIATLQDGTRSRSGVLTATFAYAAPEVLIGQRATSTSDVYSLAATLHALCTGRAPFVHDSDEHMFAVLRRIDAEPPADLRPLGVPDAVAAVIEAGMAKSSGDRPQTAAEFAHLLQPAASRPATVAPLPVDPATPLASSLAPPPPAGPPPAGPPQAAGPDPAAASALPPHDDGATVITTLPVAASTSRPRRRVLVAAVVAVLVLAVAGLGVVLTSGGDGDQVADDDAGDGGSGDGSDDPGDGEAAPLPDPAPGQIVTVVGTGVSGDSGDGPAASTTLDNPVAIAVGGDGNLNIADTGRNRIRIVSGGLVTTVAGPPADDLAAPAGIAVLDGVLFADTEHNQIGRVAPNGTVSVIAGTGEAGYFGDDGPATEAQLNRPNGLAVGPDGSIYVADSFNDVVRRIDPDGIITTVAGTGEPGYSGDNGPATEAQLHFPLGVAVADDGTVFVADTDNHRIRRVSGGIITTIAGTATDGTGGFSGDGGPAVEAELDGPGSVAVGPDGTVYFADTFNNVVRVVRTDGSMKTFAGTGEQGADGDGGLANEAQLDNPRGVAIGPDGDLYIVDSNNHRICRVGS